MAGVRKIRWWERFFDPVVRRAYQAKKDAANTDMQTVDYTDTGIAIVMPQEIADQWDMMPAEVREEFMRAVSAQMGKESGPEGVHEWIGG